MRLNNVSRLLVLALIITAFYFIFVREKSPHRNPSRQQSTASTEPSTHGGWAGSRHPTEVRNRNGQRAQRLRADSGLSCSSEYFSRWTEPLGASCQILFKGGYPVPDPRCTPGGINPSISVEVLRDPRWRTRSVRNCDTSEAQKHIAYRWYDVQKPRINSNQNQVCELDHLVPLELGGADGLGNIWPQCGPDAVTLNARYFKQKDRVENYLAQEVKSGRIALGSAQRGIASDWTQYLPDATRWCQDAGHC